MAANHGLSTQTQFSLFLVNKPGALAKVLQRLADGKINIVAMSMMDSTEHGVMRLVAEDPAHVRASLKEVDLPATETDVLTAVLPNRPGALADVVERLSRNRISVNYAYCTTGAAGGRTLGIFKVSSLAKAMQTLSERKPKRKQTASIRGNGRARRK